MVDDQRLLLGQSPADVAATPEIRNLIQTHSTLSHTISLAIQPSNQSTHPIIELIHHLNGVEEPRPVVFVRLPSRNAAFYVGESPTIAAVKKEIESKHKIPAHTQQLELDGVVLDGSQRASLRRMINLTIIGSID